MHTELPLYGQVAQHIERLIGSGSLRTGQRVPSVRRLSRQLGVSISTVVEAYRRLEDLRVIESRPRSGFYVRPPSELGPTPRASATARRATELEPSPLSVRVLVESQRPDLLHLGAAVPSPELLPLKRIARSLRASLAEETVRSLGYGELDGMLELRQEVARNALSAGMRVGPEQVLITAGAQQAITLALMATTRAGDIVAVENPTYYGLLEALEALELKALGIATNPETGLDVDALEAALDEHPVAAVALIPNGHNPLGCTMPEAAKRRLAALASQRELPIIEDDVYGELFLEGTRPKAISSFDRSGRVIYCTSISKTLAPGLRIGWAITERYYQSMRRLKLATSVSTAPAGQLAIARMLRRGGVEHHYKSLRQHYREMVGRSTAVIVDAFPAGTRVSRPKAGHVLWIELPSGSALELHEKAIAAGMTIAPGPLFAPCGGHCHALRINVAQPWSEALESSLIRLGQLAKSL